MDASSDLICPALLFTLLAIIIAAIITRRNRSPASLKHTRQTPAAGNEKTCRDSEESSQNNDARYSSATHHPDIQHHTNANKSKHETIQPESSSDHEEEVCRSDCTVHSSSRREEDSAEDGIRNALKDYAQSPDANEKPLRYMAGMLRTSQLEKMMTKEELEEEKRVQQNQLTAIFQLLRDKQETFGDVTESDLQEQLKLYSI